MRGSPGAHSGSRRDAQDLACEDALGLYPVVDHPGEPLEIRIGHAHDDTRVGLVLLVQFVEIFAVERQDRAPSDVASASDVRVGRGFVRLPRSWIVATSCPRARSAARPGWGSSRWSRAWPSQYRSFSSISLSISALCTATYPHAWTRSPAVSVG